MSKITDDNKIERVKNKTTTTAVKKATTSKQKAKSKSTSSSSKSESVASNGQLKKTTKTNVKNKNSKSKIKSSEKKSTTGKKLNKEYNNEYYDLPYRYNQTVVKVLAQTPTILFVYWDISDEDRKFFQSNFGDNFFNTTKPVLVVHNKTKNYTFEIDINDFANSWYIKTQEPDCDYVIELGRRPINNNSEYIYISSSNNIISPNNHVLFEKTNFNNVKFTNVKNNSISYKNFGSLKFINNIRKIYSKPEFSSLEEFLNENNANINNQFKLNNPSSPTLMK